MSFESSLPERRMVGRPAQQIPQAPFPLGGKAAGVPAETPNTLEVGIL
jgi:hypothetical protein